MERSPRSRRKKSVVHDEEHVVEPVDIDLRAFIPDSLRVASFSDAAKVTAPDFSVIFILLFSVAAYFYKSHPLYVGIIICGWILLQLIMYVSDEDFQSDIFWNVFTLIGYCTMYLIFGIIWSMAKLYLDVCQKQLPSKLHADIIRCVGPNGASGCTSLVLDKLKTHLLQSVFAFPISIAYTMSCDPLKLMGNLIMSTFYKTYIRIIKSAVNAFLAREAADIATKTSASWTAIGMSFFVIASYLIIGYLWTHVKLFIDVWQGTLPRRYDTAIRSVWSGDGNYWSFMSTIKHLIVQWVLFWPFSIIYTILRHPMTIIVEIIYRLSKRKYVWIISKAMEKRMKVE